MWRILGALLGIGAFCTSTLLGQQVAETGGARRLWPQRPGRVEPLPVQVPTPLQSQAEFAPNQVLVQFRETVTDADRAAAQAAVDNTGVQDLRAPHGRLELISTPLAVPDAVRILQTLPGVEFAEPDWIARPAADADDYYFELGELWGMYGGTTAPRNPFGSQAAELWARGFVGSEAVFVGVIDTGIDIDHPDLAPNIWTNPFDPVDGVDNDLNGYIDDVHGWDFVGKNNSVYDGSPSTPTADIHGTHVAGTIGARGRNAMGVAGVNWTVTIVPMKFMNTFGLASNAVLAVNYLTDLRTRHGLDVAVANCSWTMSYSTALHEAINRAAKSGMLVIAAAGNDGKDNGSTPRYPASLDTTQQAGGEPGASFDAVIAVAAIDAAGELAGFSNYSSTDVEIGGPGVSVISTAPRFASAGGYALRNGTSMATAHVTGAAAIYRAMNPRASGEEIRAALLDSAFPTLSLAGKTVTGGRLAVGGFSATPFSYTDSPLVPRVHQLRAVHLGELRTRINDIRVRVGLPAVQWTDPWLGRSVTVKAAHFQEVRDAIEALYEERGQPAPGYAEPIVAGTFIKAAHITELREALSAVDD